MGVWNGWMDAWEYIDVGMDWTKGWNNESMDR